MKRWITPIATLAGMAVMIACAHAQEAQASPAQAPTQPAKTQAKKKPADDKKTTPATQAKKGDDKADATDDDDVKPLLNSLTLGYTTWNSSGNINALHQNGYVNGGFGIADLSLMTPYDKQRYYAFEFTGLPGQDFGLRLISQWGVDTTLVTTAHQLSYFDPSYGTLDPSRSLDFSSSVSQILGSNFGAFGLVDLEHQDEHFPAPLAQPNYVNRTLAVGSQKQVGDSNVGATFVETSYSDIGNVQPQTLTDRGEVRYSGTFGPRLSAEGNISVSLIQQQGQANSWVNNYGVSGVYDLNDESAVGAHLDRMDLDLNSVQNAYVRKKLESGVTYDTRLGTWGLGFGYAHREEERLRSDHSYVDVPEWNDYSVKLNGRLAKKYRLGVKATLEDLSSQPVFQTQDPTLLYWERKSDVQAKLSTGDEINTGYLSVNEHYRRNDERDFYLNWTNVSLGGSHVFSPKLLGYAEYATDQYSVGGSNAEATALGDYFPTSETFMFGADYTRNTRENFSFVMTSFYTQDEWGQQIAVTYHRDLGKDRNFSITYSPWLQRDRLYDVDTFTAPILTVKIGTRF